MANKYVKAVLPLLAFGLPQRPGQIVELEEKQADEVIDLAYAVEATPAEVKAFKAASSEALKKDNAGLKELKDALESETKAKELAQNELANVKSELELVKSELELVKNEKLGLADELEKLKGADLVGEEEVKEVKEEKTK